MTAATGRAAADFCERRSGGAADGGVRACRLSVGARWAKPPGVMAASLQARPAFRRKGTRRAGAHEAAVRPVAADAQTKSTLLAVVNSA